MWKPLLICCLTVQFVFAQEMHQRMTEVVESYVTSKQFMGSVLLARGPEIELNQGFGSADLEWSIPNAPSTKFRLGSVTKQFTAASILLLQERGKLSVRDLVKKYMPDAPASWDKITIFNLLTHTSGIPNFTSFPDYPGLEAKPTTPQQLVARFRDKPLDFEPGTKWNYSNSGYILLGYLLEKISGQKYQEFLQQNIFGPLGMKDSGYDSNSAIIPRRASGYSPSDHGIVNAGYIDMTIPFSAGALNSTTSDLLLWERDLYGGKLLKPASLKAMTTPFKNNYAFGLEVTKVKGRTRISHGGGIEGFNTELDYWPDEKLAVIVLGNLNGGAPGDIAYKLAGLVHGEKVTLTAERKEVQVPISVLKSYVGEYQVAPGMNMTIALAGDHLTTQLAGQPAFPIFAESPTTFFLKVVDAQLEFKKDAAGKVTQAILHQGGQTTPATKTK